jgi:hypothetical protein
MPEITYLPDVECIVEPGPIPKLLSVGVPDEDNRYHYLRVGKGQVVEDGGKHYLFIGIVDIDYKNRRVLIELPDEADSGANRLWVPFARFRQEKETP